MFLSQILTVTTVSNTRETGDINIGVLCASVMILVFFEDHGTITQVK